MLLWIFFSLLIATIRANSLIQEIMSIPENVEQLKLAFYPVNMGRLAEVVFIYYFILFNGTFLNQCDTGWYPWDTELRLQNETDVILTHWITIPALKLSSTQAMKEIGLFLPVLTWRLATGKQSPFDISSPAVCIRTPFKSKTVPLDFGGITLYDAEIWCQHSQTCMKHFQRILEILISPTYLSPYINYI